MSSFEFNKIFAAVLVAGIIAMLSGFVAKKLVHPHMLETDAVAVDDSGGAASAGGAAGPVGPEPILHLIATADVAKGEKLSKACAACHSFDQGGPQKVGPNLWGVLGGPKAHISGFAYSDGLAKMGADGGRWNYQEMNKFFWKPKAYIADTKMNFIGLKKPQDRADLIAWLNTLGSNKPAPTEAEIAAEKAELAPEPAAETAAPAAAEGGEAPAAAGEAPKADAPKEAAPTDAKPADAAH